MPACLLMTMGRVAKRNLIYVNLLNFGIDLHYQQQHTAIKQQTTIQNQSDHYLVIRSVLDRICLWKQLEAAAGSGVRIIKYSQLCIK